MIAPSGENDKKEKEPSSRETAKDKQYITQRSLSNIHFDSRVRK
jgi:hypothetical protein